MSNEKPFVRRERRFEVGDLKGFDAIVSRAGTDESVYFAELIDFSRTGVKFGLPFNARFDEMLYILFEFKHSNLTYEGKGRVRHIRNIEEQRWHVGCSLDPPLTEEVISFLAKRTNQDRRRYHRIEVDGKGTLVRQGTIEGCDAEIVNVSEGGFCLLVDKEQDPGQRVDFRIQNEHGKDEKIAARVRWQKEIDGRFRIGCGYADSASYEKLINCLSFDESAVGSDEKISWYVAAAAMLAMFLPPLSYFLFGTNAENTKPAASMAVATRAEPRPITIEQADQQEAFDRKVPEVAASEKTNRSPVPMKDDSDSNKNTHGKQPSKSQNKLIVEHGKLNSPAPADRNKHQSVDPQKNEELATSPEESMISFLPFDIMDETFEADSDTNDDEIVSDIVDLIPEIVKSAALDPEKPAAMSPHPEAGSVEKYPRAASPENETIAQAERQRGISTRRSATRVSQTTPEKAPQQISFDTHVPRPQMEQIVNIGETNTKNPSPTASSRRGSKPRSVVVPSEIIRKRLMSEAPAR